MIFDHKHSEKIIIKRLLYCIDFPIIKIIDYI